MADLQTLFAELETLTATAIARQPQVVANALAARKGRMAQTDRD